MSWRPRASYRTMATADPTANAAASRAYYAAYLAIAHRAQARGFPFTSPKDYYRHDELPDDAARWGIIDDEGRDVLTLLHATRIKADYWADHVELVEAAEVTQLAEDLVSKLLDEVV